MPLTVELHHPNSLPHAHWQCWQEIQTAEPSLESPYFHPQFTKEVAAVRRDVEVAVLKNGGSAVGFFPFQRGPLNIGKPVGGKLSDYQGVIAAVGTEVDPADLIRGCKLAGWDFDHLVTTQKSFEPFAHDRGDSPYLDLTRGYEAYAAERRAAGSDELKKIGQKMRKCERERGELTFDMDCRDESVLSLLLRWKSAQYRANGLADAFAFPWTVALLQSVFRGEETGFGGLLTVLRLNHEPISILFSLRCRGVVHGWIFAYDKEVADYSPGSILLQKMAQEAAANGITKIDLGKGTERYKLSMASAATPLWEGTLGRASPALWLRSGWRTTRDWLKQSPLAKLSKTSGRVIQPLRDWLQFH